MRQLIIFIGIILVLFGLIEAIECATYGYTHPDKYRHLEIAPDNQRP